MTWCKAVDPASMLNRSVPLSLISSHRTGHTTTMLSPLHGWKLLTPLLHLVCAGEHSTSWSELNKYNPHTATLQAHGGLTGWPVLSLCFYS